MALLRPPLEALGQLIAPLNDGELRVARALASQLDDSWTVYIQPRLEFDVPDFVAAHDQYGVCAIEVKDWAYNKYTLAPNGTVQYLNGSGWNPTDESGAGTRTLPSTSHHHAAGGRWQHRLTRQSASSSSMAA